MALDPSISLQVGRGVPQIDVAGAATQAMNLRALAQQSQLQDLQLQQQQRQMADQEAMRGAYVVGQDGRIDNAATLRNLARVNPAMAQKFHFETTQNELAGQKAQREAEKAQLETVGKRMGMIRDALASLGQNATYADVQRVAMSLRNQGIPVNLEEIPQEQGQLQQYLQEQRIQTDAIFRNYHEMTKPQTNIERLTQAEQRWIEQNSRYAEGGSRTDGMTTTVSAPASPFRQAILREQYGNPPDGFMWGEGGRPIPMPAVQAYELEKRKAGAAKHTQIMNAPYEKKLSEKLAEAVSDQRIKAEGLTGAAGEIRAIADILKGVRGGKWDEWKASIGQYLPGSEWAKLTNINQVAESIRQKAAPAQRVPGSGSTSDIEFKGMLAAIPSLLTYESGRELIARTFERRAEQARISADIANELAAADKYSSAAHAAELKKRFGERLMTPEDLKLMRQIQSGKADENATPSKDYRSLWRKP